MINPTDNMIVEDDGAWYVVRSVLNDDIIGPFDEAEDAQNWLSSYYQTERHIDEGLQNEN